MGALERLGTARAQLGFPLQKGNQSLAPKVLCCTLGVAEAAVIEVDPVAEDCGGGGTWLPAAS